jgi:site-specific recombinase XerD
MYYKIPPCSGPFRDVITEYVEYKRGLGYDYGKPTVYRLREIDLFFKQHGVTSVEVTEEMFLRWEKRREGESVLTQRKRVAALNMFSKFLLSRGFSNIYVGETAPEPHAQFIPYIFSKAEIAAMFDVFKQRAVSGNTETTTFATMFCLYYGCGLRKTEAQNLRIRDINRNTGSIRILDSKNHVSRLVMASESVTRQVTGYIDRFCVGCAADSYLFQNGEGGMFRDWKLYSTYQKTMIAARIRPRESGRLPRLHDLRHTFCVHTLEALGSKGFDLYTSLPLLVAYLGHKCISETEYYLRLVDANFTSVTDASRAYAPSLFPEVSDGDGK